MPRKNALRTGARLYKRAIFWWWLPNWRSDERAHAHRIRKLERSDRSAGEPAPLDSSAEGSGPAAGGFGLPDYGSMRPTDQD